MSGAGERAQSPGRHLSWLGGEINKSFFDIPVTMKLELCGAGHFSTQFNQATARYCYCFWVCFIYSMEKKEEDMYE